MVNITHSKYLEYIFQGVKGMDDSNDEAFEFPYNKLAKRVRALEESVQGLHQQGEHQVDMNLRYNLTLSQLDPRLVALEEGSATREKLNKAYDHNAKLVAQYMDVFQSMERELQLLHIRIDDLEKDVGNK